MEQFFSSLSGIITGGGFFSSFSGIMASDGFFSSLSGIITGGGVFIVLYITFIGFWPFTKAFGLFGLCSFWRQARQLERKIEEAIQKLPQSNTIEEQRNQFVRQYNKIDEYFSNNGSIFRHLWPEFTEQLIEPSDQGRVFQNSIRPENFFTLEYFFKQKNINLKLLESMPGILVGLGVLGTFVGLSISLILALGKLEGGDTINAINGLIEGAGVAFFTSVAGLSCSLIFNIVSDKKTSVLQTHLSKFNSILERSLKFITEEHLLTMYLKELHQQGKYLENMDEKIALKIGDMQSRNVSQMGEKFQQIISQNNHNISENFLKNITHQMTQGMGNFSKNWVENIEKTINSLQDNIPQLVSNLKQSQKQQEESTKTFIEQLSTSNKNSQEQLNESLIHTMQNMKTTFEEITQNLKQGMGNTLSDFSERNNMLSKQTEEAKISFQKHVDQTTDKLHTFTDRLDKMISELGSTTTHNIQLALDKFNEAVNQQNQIVEKNEKYIHSLDSLSGELKEVSHSVSNVIIKSHDFIEKIESSNKFLQEKWENYEQRFSNVDESATKLFEKIHEGLESVAKRSTEYISDLNKQSSKVSANFTSAVEELTEAISELSDIVNKLKSNK